MSFSSFFLSFFYSYFLEKVTLKSLFLINYNEIWKQEVISITFQNLKQNCLLSLFLMDY